MGRWPGTLGGLALALLVLAGCAEDGGSDGTEGTAGAPTSPVTSSAPAVGPAVLQLRVVESVGAPGGGCTDPVDPAAGEATTLCDADGRAYRLEPAAWAGTVAAAEPEVPDQSVEWVLNLDLPRDGTQAFADLSGELAGTGTQVALVVDGELVSAPVLNAPITDGKLQINGGFTERTANELADRLVGR